MENNLNEFIERIMVLDPIVKMALCGVFIDSISVDLEVPVSEVFKKLEKVSKSVNEECGAFSYDAGW